VHTGFITEQSATLFASDSQHVEQLWILACVGRLEARRARAARDGSPWADTSAFRINAPRMDELVFLHEGKRLAIPVTFGAHAQAGVTLLGLPSRTVSLRQPRLEGSRVSCELDGQRLAGRYVEEAGRGFVFANGRGLELLPFPSPLASEDEVGASDVVKAPMSGKIHAVLVAVGARVSRGQPLLSLEAMKMEHTLGAPRAGEVEALFAAVGEQVEEGRTLLVLAAAEEA
jgi:3-methylcrotonyl-CoA carboxylase alpha subunit